MAVDDAPFYGCASVAVVTGLFVLLSPILKPYADSFCFPKKVKARTMS